MLRWYDLAILNLVTSMIFTLLDRRYKILPLTNRSVVVFGIYMVGVVLFWVFVLVPWGFEGTTAQIKQFIYSMIAIWPINALSARFLLGRATHD